MDAPHLSDFGSRPVDTDRRVKECLLPKSKGRKSKSRPPKRPKTIAAPTASAHDASPATPVSGPVTIVASELGLQPLEVEDRATILQRCGILEALPVAVALYSRFDDSLLSQTTRPFEAAIMRSLESPWAERLRTIHRTGRSVLSPASMTQLIREIIEFCSLDAELHTETFDNKMLVELVLSINSEHDKSPYFTSSNPSEAEKKRVAKEFDEIDTDELRRRMREITLVEVARLQSNSSLVVESVVATASDTWLHPWPDKTPHELIGESPEHAYQGAVGVPLLEMFKLGKVLVEDRRQKLATVTREELASSGAKPAAIDNLFRTMSLRIQEYRKLLAKDRLRGATENQRYTFTQFPFLRIDDRTVIQLRRQWAADRFFGEHVYMQAWASFKEAGKNAHANQLKSAMNDVFERLVSNTLERIAAFPVPPWAKTISVVHEQDMQDAWTDKKGLTPSVCDWAVASGPSCLVIDATNHTQNFKLAQGLADEVEYWDDVTRIFLKGKFKQLASTIRFLRERSFGDTGLGANTCFIPTVIVPNGGLPNTEMVDFDISQHSHEMFKEFSPNVLPPSILTFADLELLEGLAEFRHSNIVQLMTFWRAVCASSTPPPRLQTFLEQKGLDRPVPNHAIRTARRMYVMLDPLV